MWPLNELAKLDYFVLFMVGFTLVAALVLFIVAWAKEGSTDMWWILLGSAGAGVLMMILGHYAKKKYPSGGRPNLYGY